MDQLLHRSLFVENKEGLWKTGEIILRDPFVFVDREQGAYFLFGTTFSDSIGTIEPHFSVYKSRDLMNWEGPHPAFQPEKGFWGVRHYWAPEVHEVNGRYYMFISAKGGIGEKRGTGVLVADHPQGPYRDHSHGPLTPKDWECLDGTFYQDEEGQNWLVFCHEWTEIEDGTLNAVPLSADLTRSIGEPIELVSASSMDWVRPFHDLRTRQSGYLTDAPFVFQTPAGTLLLLWSSYSDPRTHHGGYTVAVLKSETGKVTGPWLDAGLLLDNNAGHPSLFQDLEGKWRLCCHFPDTPHGMERAVFYPVEIQDESIKLTTKTSG